MTIPNRDDLIVKGAQARLHELLAEVRELMLAIEQLPRTITVSVNAVPKKLALRSTPARAADYQKRSEKRKQTMLARYGTANPRLVKQRKAQVVGLFGFMPTGRAANQQKCQSALAYGRLAACHSTKQPSGSA